MLQEILLKAILTAVGFIVTGLLGYFSAQIKQYKEKEKKQAEKDNNQEEALKCILRSLITSKYYTYKELGVIPYYEKENVDYMFEQYRTMGGNSYVEQIVNELNRLPIKK